MLFRSCLGVLWPVKIGEVSEVLRESYDEIYEFFPVNLYVISLGPFLGALLKILINLIYKFFKIL